MGRHLSPRYGQLSIDDNIDVQSAFSWAPKVARKCESKHWYACGAGGRAIGRSRDYQIFWDEKIYLPMVLRARSSAIRCGYTGHCWR